jgi:hypothetical protein
VGRTGAGVYFTSVRVINNPLPFDRQKLVDSSPLPVFISLYLFLVHILMACNSIVELQSGQIEIDGTNIRNIGLDVLRARLALVPQDSTLLSGSLRDNL